MHIYDSYVLSKYCIDFGASTTFSETLVHVMSVTLILIWYKYIFGIQIFLKLNLVSKF